MTDRYERTRKAVRLNAAQAESADQVQALREASITVPADQVSRPTIDAQVLDNIREQMRQAIGVDMRIALVEPEGGDDAGG